MTGALAVLIYAGVISYLIWRGSGSVIKAIFGAFVLGILGIVAAAAIVRRAQAEHWGIFESDVWFLPLAVVVLVIVLWMNWPKIQD